MLPTDERIRRLTWFQLIEIVWHQRDEHGGIVVPPPERMSDEERVKAGWAKWGLTDEELEHKWQEFLEIEGYRWKLEATRPPGIPDEAWSEDAERRVREFERSLIAKRTWGR